MIKTDKQAIRKMRKLMNELHKYAEKKNAKCSECTFYYKADKGAMAECILKAVADSISHELARTADKKW